MLSDDQLAEFGRRGVVRLPGVITADVAGMIEDRIWEFLDERAGAVRDDPSTWPDTIGKLQPLRKAAVFDPRS